MALPQRRDRVDDDVDAGVGFGNGLEAFLVFLHKRRRRAVGVEVVGAERHDDAAGLHQGDGLRHRLVAGIPLQFDAGVVRQGAAAHAYRADGVVVGAVVKHAVHAGGVAVAQKQRFVDVFLAGILGLLQDRRLILCIVDGVAVFIVAALGDHRLAGCIGGILAAKRFQPADQHKRHRDADQQHQAAQRDDQVHFAAQVQRFAFCLFLGFACHPCFLSDWFMYIQQLLYTILGPSASVFSIFTYFSTQKSSPPCPAERAACHVWRQSAPWLPCAALRDPGKRCARVSAGSSAR